MIEKSSILESWYNINNLRELQFMVSTPDNSSLLLDQDTNQFLVSAGNDPRYLIKLYDIHFSNLSNKYITSCDALNIKDG